MNRMIRLALVGVLLALALPGCFLDWSPDGKQLVVAWGKGDDKGALALVNADGTGFRWIPESDNGLAPSWSPDGKWIVFAVNEDRSTAPPGSMPAYLYDVEKNVSRKLPEAIFSPFIWREDSRRFVGMHSLEDGSQEAVWYNLPEGGVSLRVKLPEGGVSPINQNAVWLPGTDDIAFLGSGQTGEDIYTIEAGEVKRVTTTGDVVGLGLTADHRKLIWARKSKNLKYILLSLYTYDLKARSTARLPFPERIPLLNPDPRHAPDTLSYVTFAPDGRRLAIIAVMPVSPDPQTKQPRQRPVCVSMKLDGTDARMVRQGKLSESPEAVLMPAFSRDGKKLAVWAGEGQDVVVAVFSADGTGGKRLLPGSTP